MTLIDCCEKLPDDATLITPLASTRFRMTDVLRQEIGRLEQRIQELTEFSSGNSFGPGTESG